MRLVNLPLLVVCCALAVAAGCGPSEPLKITTIQLGRSLNSDDSIANHTTSFHPKDTIYASLINDAAGAGTVSARWVYAGQTVSEETKEVSFTREGATEFHLRSPSAGFPPGDYRVEFQVDGKPVGTREFRVAE
jgi:hypothetical protein